MYLEEVDGQCNTKTARCMTDSTTMACDQMIT